MPTCIFTVNGVEVLKEETDKPDVTGTQIKEWEVDEPKNYLVKIDPKKIVKRGRFYFIHMSKEGVYYYCKCSGFQGESF